MKVIQALGTATLLLACTSASLAFPAPTFWIDDCAWRATDIVVVLNGEKFDGVVEMNTDQHGLVS
jgi:hypothetical protein